MINPFSLLHFECDWTDSSLTCISSSRSIIIDPDRVTPPAVVRTLTRLRGLVPQVRAVSHSVTHQLGLGHTQAARTGGAPCGLIRHVATLAHSVAPEAGVQAQVVVTPGRVLGAAAQAGIGVRQRRADREAGGRAVGTLSLVLALGTIPVSARK